MGLIEWCAQLRIAWHIPMESGIHIVTGLSLVLDIQYIICDPIPAVCM